MELSNTGDLQGFPLHTIKKVKMIEDRHRENPNTESRVNQLLSKGWVLLALNTKEVSPKEQLLIYTLGHTDASADDTAEAIWQT